MAALALVLGGIGQVVESVGNAMSSAGSGSGSSSSMSSGYSGGSAKPSCDGRREDCFKIVKIEWEDRESTRYEMVCTKGEYAGRKECIYYNKSNGQWSACGMGGGFYRNNSRETGNLICGE